MTMLAPAGAPPAPAPAQGLSASLSALQTSLGGAGAGSFELSSATLTGTSLFAFLQTALGSQDSVSVTGTLGAQGAALVLSGTASVLGMNGAAVSVTFTDPVQTATPQTRAIVMVMEITAPGGWSLGTSFSSLSGTVLDQVSYAESPLLIVASTSYADSTLGLVVEAGLSLYAQVLLNAGSLQPLAGYLGTSAQQTLYGPLALMSDGSAVAALALQGSFPVTVTGFPALALTATVEEQVSTATPQLMLYTPFAATGLPSFPAGGPAGSAQAVLAYAPATPTTVSLTTANLWTGGGSLAAALPQALQSAACTLVSAGVTVAPGTPPAVTQVYAVTLPPAATWTLITGGFTLGQVQATLESPSASLTTCTLAGEVAVGTSGTLVLTGQSSTGFAAPWTLSLDAGASTLPTVADLAASFTIGTNLPSGVWAMGTVYSGFSFSVGADGTGTTATAGLTSTGAWTLVSGQFLTLATTAAVSFSLTQATHSSALVPGGSVSGEVSFAGQTLPVSVTLPATSTQLTVTVDSPTFQLPALVTAVLGSGATATPQWLSTAGFSSGTLTVDYGQKALTGTSLPVNGTITVPNEGGTLTGMTANATASESVAAVSLAGTWNLPGSGAALPGVLTYPFTEFGPPAGQSWPACQIPPPPSPPPANASDQQLTAQAMELIKIGLVGTALAAAVLWLWRYANGVPASRAVKIFLGIFASIFGASLLTFLVYALANSYDDDGNQAAQDVAKGSDGSVGANELAPVLQQQFSLSAADCATALSGAYSLTAQQMADALQAAGYTPAEVVPVLQADYPSDTATVADMVGLLNGAWTGDGALGAQAMATALAAGYTVQEVAPGLQAAFPADTATAAEMVPLLTTAYASASPAPTDSDYAEALQACGFGLASIIPPLLPTFINSSSTETLSTFATDVIAPYAATAPVSAMQLSLGLALAGQAPSAAFTAVTAAVPGVPSVQLCSIQAALYDSTGAVLSTVSAGAAQAASLLASGDAAATAAPLVFQQQTGMGTTALAGVLYSIFTPPPLDVDTFVAALCAVPLAAGDAAVAVVLALAPATITAQDMANALAAAGYTVQETAPALQTAFPSDTATAAEMVPLLATAYNGDTTADSDYAEALQACGFGLASIIPPLLPTFINSSSTETLSTFATDVIAPYAATAPVSDVQLAIGLATAQQAADDASPAILAALGTTTATQMAAALLVAYDADLPAALTTAQGQSTASAAATAIVNQQATIALNTAAGVLYSVFTPPAPTVDGMVTALVAGFGSTSSVIPEIAVALQVCWAPALLTANDVAAALAGPAGGTGSLAAAVTVATALQAAGYSESDAQAALLAAGFGSLDTCTAITQVYGGGGTVLSLPSTGSYVSIPSISAYSFGGTGDFTLQAAVNGSDAGVVLQCQDSPPTGAGWSLSISSSGPGQDLLTLATNDGSSDSATYFNSVPVTLLDGNWHQLLASRQTTSGTCTYALYVDGTELTGFQPSSTQPVDVTSTAELTVGAASGGWEGDVAEVVLWSVALTPSTVPGSASDLVGSWSFENGLTDASSNANDGTLQGDAALVTGSVGTS